MKRSAAALVFLLWAGILLSSYYVVQRPGSLGAFAGLASTLWTLTVAGLLIFNGYVLGTKVLTWLGPDSIVGVDRLLLGTGAGLGILGVLALAISAAQIARLPVFFFALLGLTIFCLAGKSLANLVSDLRTLGLHWNLSWSQYDRFTKLTLLLLFTFSFLLTLAPQFEAFDALLYHLTQPARVLQDGGLERVNIPHFWFPNLTENVYLWGLALGSERAAQILHWSWGVLSVGLLWHWAVTRWDVEVGRKVLLLLASIVSLPMLASWAYADLALVFYAAASLYALTHYQSSGTPAWLRLTGLMAGLAMAVKYTSFTVPLACGLLILYRERDTFPRAVLRAVQFSLVTLAVASSWYLRNAIWMGNPFYPFAFGGRDWDAFRAGWYASPGSGIGWDARELLLLPINVILGHRDQNFFDGRAGPLFLLLAPLALWVLLTRARQGTDRGTALQAIGLFAALSGAAWTFGVISSQSLWQARLLFPALLPFALPAALGWDSLKLLDTSKFRISFFANAVIAIVIALAVFDHALFFIARNPLGVAVGAQSRAAYIARVNPPYAALIQTVEELPASVSLYSLFEPRSYGLPRRVQPDPINDNFFHDLHVYKTPDAIVEHWKAEGYTHVIVSERGRELTKEDTLHSLSTADHLALEQTLAQLALLRQTPDGAYSIYRVP